jgi:signal transduction histidine kinase
MSATTTAPALAQPAGARAGSLTVEDLAELMRSFNDVTGRLESTQHTLRSEVRRLETELREANEQLARARELAALGEMAAGIAHEVRNPLGSIRLYASALAQDLVQLPAERELALKIAGAVTRLDAVVGDVLTFSRRLTVREEDVPASRLIDEALDSCAELFKRHGVEVVRGPEPRRAPVLRGDPALLNHALVNVVRNAAEAIGESDTPIGERVVSIEALRRRSLDTSGRAQAMVALCVRDTGPGIPAEVLSRVFNPFFTTRHTGTGLGLAIVHRIIDAHGGRVTIRSGAAEAPGRRAPRGTAVELLLPASGVNARQEAA